MPRNTPQHKRIGVFAKNLTTGKIFQYHENIEFGTASIIKICVALTLYEKSRNGELNLDQEVDVESGNESKKLGKYANGLLSYFRQDGAKLTLRLACYLMLKLSDNGATNLILRYVKQNEVNKFIQKFGFKSTKLTCDILDPKQLEKTGNLLGLTTAKEMSRIMEMIVTNKFFDSTMSGELISMMINNYPNTTFDRYLPVYWNTGEQDQKITRILNKGGSFPKFELLAETGCITSKNNQKIVVSVFTQGTTFNGKSFPSNLNPDHPGNKLIAKIISDVYTRLSSDNK